MLKLQRAWTGRLDNVSDLLSWMYDEDILNKSEKAEKDRIFRAYYRYHNDGDIPRGFKYASFNATEEHLETKVNEFISKILTKKHGKYDRRAFRKQRTNENLEHLARQASELECHSLFTYFATKYRIKGQTAYDYFDMVPEHELYNALNMQVNEQIESLDQSHLKSYDRIKTNHILSYKIRQLQEAVHKLPKETTEMLTDLNDMLTVLVKDIEKEIK